MSILKPTYLWLNENDIAGDPACCTSVYAVRFDEDGVHGVQNSAIIVDDQGWVAYDKLVTGEYVLMEPTPEQIEAAHQRIDQKRTSDQRHKVMTA